MFGTIYFATGVTSALNVDLALSSVEMLTSAPCKMITVEKASRLSKSEHFYVDENFGDRI